MSTAISIIFFATFNVASVFSNDGQYSQQLGSSSSDKLSVDFTRASPVRFFLFTRQNPTSSQELVEGNSSTLSSSNFVATKPTKMVIHGYTDNGNIILGLMGKFTSATKDAFLAAGDFNVISVDWSRDSLKPYVLAVRLVPDMGKQVAGLIDWLITSTGTSANSFHLVGHSMGAQISASASRQMRGGKFAQITALDPAKPLFEEIGTGITANDAAYVELVHTNTLMYGMSRPHGHNDFYVNWGAQQPGCSPLLEPVCSHYRSVELYIESLLRPGSFVGDRCSGHQEILARSCSRTGQLNMGGPSPKTALGVFYLKTNARSPFSMT